MQEDITRRNFVAEENIIVGNVSLYGATGGEAFYKHGWRAYMTKGLLVVLGPTGRNFAAGMSGGFAFVLDETGEFVANRCNKTSVDLEPVMEIEDIETIRALTRRHLELTGSPRAQWVLENWQAMLPKFIKVYPHEFKRVRTAAAKKQAEAMKLVPQVPPVPANRPMVHGD